MKTLTLSSKKWTLVMLATFFLSAASAQTFPLASNCASKDVDLVETILKGQSENSLLPGNRKMYLTLANKSTSDRRSYGLWAKMNRYDLNGVLKSSSNVFFCVDSVKKGSTLTLAAKDSLYYGADESIELTNIYTAWSAANGKEDCNYLSANTSKISPNCAVKNPAKVYTGVNARLKPNRAACGNGKGLLKAKPFGGKAPYLISVSVIGSNAQQTYTVTDTVDIELPPGQYKVTVMDSKYNSSFFTTEIGDIENIEAPVASVEHPNCIKERGDVKVTNKQNGFSYNLSQNGSIKYANVDGDFLGVEPGDYEVVASKGVCVNKGKASVNPRPHVPNKPNLNVQHPNCTKIKGHVKVENGENSVAYKLVSNGIVFTADANGDFEDLEPGTFEVYGQGSVCRGNGENGQINGRPHIPNKPKFNVTDPTCTKGKGRIDLDEDEDGDGKYDDADVASYTLIQNNEVKYTAVGMSFGDVDPGTYEIKANGSICGNSDNAGVGNQPPTPVVPTARVDKEPSLCNTSGQVTITDPIANNNGHQYWYSKDSGDTWQESNVFDGLGSGDGGGLVFLVKNKFGCISEAAVYECGSITPEVATASNKSTANELSKTTYLGSTSLDKAVTIQTIPNPFGTKVRFMINLDEGGNGSLELYNIQGQKIKTMYQGHVNPGTNFFDLTLPGQNSAQYIYIFTKDGVRTTGKITQMGK